MNVNRMREALKIVTEECNDGADCLTCPFHEGCDTILEPNPYRRHRMPISVYTRTLLEEESGETKPDPSGNCLYCRKDSEDGKWYCSETGEYCRGPYVGECPAIPPDELPYVSPEDIK